MYFPIDALPSQQLMRSSMENVETARNGLRELLRAASQSREVREGRGWRWGRWEGEGSCFLLFRTTDTCKCTKDQYSPMLISKRQKLSLLLLSTVPFSPPPPHSKARS